LCMSCAVIEFDWEEKRLGICCDNQCSEEGEMRNYSQFPWEISSMVEYETNESTETCNRLVNDWVAFRRVGLTTKVGILPFLRFVNSSE
jgi:hypothetical protein